LDHGTIVPYSLEALEADFCPVDYNDPALGVVQGVELSVWGRPRGYYIYKSHPFDANTASTEKKRVSADRMMHVKFAKRLHQIRGVSVFSSVINRLEDIKEIDESERVAARVAAAMTGFIKKGDASQYDEPTIGPEGEEELREMEFNPGMIFDDLKPGEDVGTISSNRPNNQLIAFRDSQVRAAASGLGASYSSISKNYNGTYSAQRQELVEQFVNYRTLSSFFVYRFCQPTWDGFIDAVVASRVLKVPRNVRLSTLYNTTHTMPPMPWIDPLKEANANEIDEKRGYKSRSRIIRERGLNPDQINREIQRDQQEQERLGLKLGDEPQSPQPGDSNAD
jgi:lambda family phage portal protein